MDPSKAVIPSIEKLVATRYGTAQRLVDDLQRLHPGAPPETIVELLQRKYTKELAVVAALSGGAAAVPGTGTLTALATTSADMAYTMTKLGEMIMAIGVAYGHDATSVTERKAWVLAVLSMGRGAVAGLDGAAAKVGERGGSALVARLSATQIDSLNSKLAARLVAKVGTEQGLVRLGKLLPFGIGAGVGATGNVLIVRSISKTAQRFFSESPGPRAGSIPAEASESTSHAQPPIRGEIVSPTPN